MELTIRVVYINFSIEAVRVEIAREQYLFIFVAIVFTLINIGLDVSTKRSAFRLMCIQNNIKLYFSVRIIGSKKFMKLNHRSGYMSFDERTYAFIFIFTQNQIRL